VTAGRVHHSAIAVRDVDASLRFYRDGIGLDVLMDHVFEGDWPTLFDAPSTTLRSVFLGDARHPEAGIVELVVFDRLAPGSEPMSPSPMSPSPMSPSPMSPSPMSPGAVAGPGFFLLSFYVDVDEVVARLAALGFGPVRRVEQPAPTGSVSMACVYDPDGVRVELVGVATAPG
jgi:catechol 2,3-dioxygenase-like lactoylglutathione lyase family enzyme